MASSSRPVPAMTVDNAMFWQAAAAGRLVAQKCGGCGRLRHPPRPMCPHCQSIEWDLVDLTGLGTLYSYSILHHPQHPAFSYPVIAALVELDEGLRMVANLVEVEPAAITIGMRLEVTFEPHDETWAAPLFRPAAADGR